MKDVISLISLWLACTLPACASGLPKGGTPIRIADNHKGSVQSLPVERYLVGVLEREVSGAWPPEALKAQAVASRTYALYRKDHPRGAKFDVESNVNDQVFEKRHRHSPSIIQAVKETEGEALQYNGQFIESFFHSCCGGMSESADRVWAGHQAPPLQSVHEDPYCSTCPRDHWEYQISREDLDSILSRHGMSRVRGDIEVTERDDSGRVSKISLGKKSIIDGATFRQWVGNEKIKSTLFEVSPQGDTVLFSGRGSGHGVGLCQWGAKGMADQGRDYREILEFYYPGSELITLGKAREIPHPIEILPIPPETQSVPPMTGPGVDTE